MRKIFRDQTSYVDLDDSLVRYASELCVKRPSHGTAVRRMETTGAQFDPSGRFLVADVSLFHPVLYAIGSPEPLATMSSLQRYPHMSPCLPKPVPASLDKYAGYRNSCTVKRGSFGFESQTGHLYYVTGSDDFRAYGWEIPRVEELVAIGEDQLTLKALPELRALAREMRTLSKQMSDLLAHHLMVREAFHADAKVYNAMIRDLVAGASTKHATTRKLEKRGLLSRAASLRRSRPDTPT